MNPNTPDPWKTPSATDLAPATDQELTEPLTSEEELRDLAEDIVAYCPGLTHLLLALGSQPNSDPRYNMN